MLKKVKMGEKAVSNTVTKFQAVEDAPSIVSVISVEDILTVSTHFSQNIGSFHCFEGICCLKERPAKPKYMFPIVVYRVKDALKGIVDTSLGVEVQYLLVGEKDYNKMIKLHDSVGSLEDINLQITTNNDTFQKLDITVSKDPFSGAPIKSSWRNDEKVRNYVLHYYNTFFKERIETSLGRVLTEAEYVALKQSAPEQNSYINKPVAPPPPEEEYEAVPPPPEEVEIGEDFTPEDVF